MELARDGERASLRSGRAGRLTMAALVVEG
jgi:hypothetical protein